MICTFVSRDGNAACSVHNVDLIHSPNLGGWACPESHVVFPWGTELGTTIPYGDSPPDEAITTFTPMMWATMTDEQRYKEYIRVRKALIKDVTK